MKQGKRGVKKLPMAIFIFIPIVFFVSVIACNLKSTILEKNFIINSKNAKTISDLDLAFEKKRWEAKIQSVGAETAYAEFKTSYPNLANGGMHLLSHMFGQILFDKKGYEGIYVCDRLYGSGCYHGVVTKPIASEGIGAAKKFVEFCYEKFGHRDSGCEHGIGHALLIYKGYDNLNSALEMCDEISLQKHREASCIAGIFMEFNFRSEDKEQLMRSFDEKNPYYPCTHVAAEFQSVCYTNLPQWWNNVLKTSFDREGDLCSKISDEALRNYCFKGTGRQIAWKTREPKKADFYCRKMPYSIAETYCLAGVKSAFASDPELKNMASTVCNDLTPDLNELCENEALE
jgi:hypothetical protein